MTSAEVIPLDLQLIPDISQRQGFQLSRFPVDGTEVGIAEIQGVSYRLDDNGWGIGGRAAYTAVLYSHPSPQVVVEYGTGAGAVGVISAHHPGVREAHLGDITDEVVCLAAYNMRETGSAGLLEERGGGAYVYRARAEDMAMALGEKGYTGRVDVVYYCLPQMALSLEALNQLPPNAIGDYYPLELYPNRSEWGLGLVLATGEATVPLLSETGVMVVVLGGRTPDGVVQEAFADLGYQGRVVRGQWVEQDKNTSLRPLLGTDGVQIFTGDERENYVLVGIEEAVAIQESGGKLYHRVNVWAFQLKS